MRERTYAVVLEPEDVGGFSVSVPDFPEIATQGESVDEALANAKDAIELVISCLVEHGEQVPASDAGARLERVAVAI